MNISQPPRPAADRIAHERDARDDLVDAEQAAELRWGATLPPTLTEHVASCAHALRDAHVRVAQAMSPHAKEQAAARLQRAQKKWMAAVRSWVENKGYDDAE